MSDADNRASGGNLLSPAAITPVSDTALWVANFRAREVRRPGAAFDDHFADRLARARGAAIADSIPRAAFVEWGVVMRTSAIDRLIGKVIDTGVVTVVNPGAGSQRLNRPYPLEWPSGLLLRMLPKSMRQQILRLSGAVVMQARSAAPCTM